MLFSPTLASILGVNEAIILQQVNYWIKTKEKSNQDYIDGHYWVYNSYEKWKEQFFFLSTRTVRRVFNSLENKGILLSGNFNKAGFDRTKWYTIDYEVLNSIISSGQSGHMVYPNCPNPNVQPDQANTIDYPKTTSETTLKIKGANQRICTQTQKNNYSNLEKQIISACNEECVDPEDFINIIEYYYMKYKSIFGKEHPPLSFEYVNRVVQALEVGTDIVDGTDFDMYREIIDKHFETQYANCDYNILHFISDEIRDNRFHEACY